MFGKSALLAILAWSLMALIACQTPEVATPTATSSSTESLSAEQMLTLGDVSDDPADTIEAFQPLADYLATSLADVGIQQDKVMVAPDLETMLEYLKTGQVDLYFESPYGALTV